MAAVIPHDYRDLFKKKVFASLVTLMPDGSPQVTPVWIDCDDRYVLVNTAVDRQKDKNLRRDKRVAVMLIDPDNPYRYLEVRGVVAERTREGADEHINKLSKKYLGKDVYPFRLPGEQRVLYRIEPTRVGASG